MSCLPFRLTVKSKAAWLEFRDCVRGLTQSSGQSGRPDNGVSGGADIPVCLKGGISSGRQECLPHRQGQFLLALGGEHTVTYGVVEGLVDDLSDVTVVQIDAHADLADELARPALVARHGDAAALGAGLPAGADRHPQSDPQRT